MTPVKVGDQCTNGHGIDGTIIAIILLDGAEVDQSDITEIASIVIQLDRPTPEGDVVIFEIHSDEDMRPQKITLH